LTGEEEMAKNIKIRNLLKMVVAAIILLIIPRIIPNSYIMQLVINVLIYVILTMGLNLLTGFTGILSLGHAAFFGVGAYTAAILNVRYGVSFYITLPAAIIITVICSLLLSIPALKVKGSYLVLMTIGFGEVVRLLLVNWIPLTNGPNGIVGISYPELGFFKITSIYQCYYLIILFVVLLAIYQKVLMRSRVGRAMLSIRDDDNAAELCGIDIAQYKIKAFAISAAYCAIAGSLYAHTIRYVSPDSFRSEESQLILCCVIIGGIGTFKGPVIGAVLLTLIPEVLRGLDDLRMVFYGIVLVIVIIFFPGGIAKYWDLIILKIKSKVISKVKNTNNLGKTK
jgi:branched-chain amino acid transport system permease protein